MSIKYSVCIPMYNEEKIVLDTAKQLVAFLDEKLGHDDFEVLFSNDGSRDSCADIIEKFSKEEPRVRLVGYPDNHGKGCAVRTAVLAAEGENILYTDCDLAYGLDKITEMFGALTSGDSDLVIGSRNLSADGYAGYTALRKLMSKIYIKVIALFAGFKYTDSQCGIKCLKHDAAKAIFSECQINGFAFDLEVLILADQKKYKVSEQAVTIINHRQSESKVNPVKDAIKMLRDVSNIKKIHKKKK